MTVDLHAKALTQSMPNRISRSLIAQGGGKEDKKPGQVTVDSGERRREFLHQVTPSVTVIAPFKQTMKAVV